ncbi:MAG: hypothetical protein R3C40_10635 [Parvularculaceae bacterium]
MTDTIAQTAPSAPELTVIVTVVDGGEVLMRSLDALATQKNPPAMRVIVPYDATIPEIAGMAVRYPQFEFPDLGALCDGAPKDAFEQHVVFDKRRSGGLAAATGPLVALVEDRGWAQPDWARKMVEAHAKYPDGAIGGAIDCAAATALNWAIFFADYGRYQAPFDSARPDYASDTNICYKRAAVEATRSLWATQYREAEVNWAVRDRAGGLRLDDGPKTVQQRLPARLGKVMHERLHWGRMYGLVRAEGVPFAGRLKWLLAAPILPLFLYVRHLRRQLRLGRHVGWFVRATPAMFFILFFWALGEFAGYLGAPMKKKDT